MAIVPEARPGSRPPGLEADTLCAAFQATA
jgi:hypothetical protein